MNIVIGAGPAGLYTAIKLKQAGVTDVVVYDPRAGSYTRPGHLNPSTFTTAEKGIGREFWSKPTGHIKDLERALFTIALSLGVKIENKFFVGLHHDTTKPGIVIAEKDAVPEMIEADYIFDCTGTHRKVVHAMNKASTASTLKLAKYTDLPVSNHFLAYIKMPENQFLKLKVALDCYRAFPAMIPALSFGQSMTKLRALGWNELKFPLCTTSDLGKGKVCLYLHAPEHLLAKDYDLWVRTVLECYSTTPSFEHLPPSKKFPSKPRFMPFTVTAQALDHVAYKEAGLPAVIALGDAQIDPDFLAGHGIENGMVRIDALFDSIEIKDGKISRFNADDYEKAIQKHLRSHKNDLTRQATNLKRAFLSASVSAKLKLTEALTITSDEGDKIILRSILLEIEARQLYVKARQIYAEYQDDVRLKLRSAISLDTAIAKLEQVQTPLSEALLKLPESCTKEREYAESLLTHLTKTWKRIGDGLVKANKIPQAIFIYKNALKIYKLPDFQHDTPLEKYTLITELQQHITNLAISIEPPTHTILPLSTASTNSTEASSRSALTSDPVIETASLTKLGLFQPAQNKAPPLVAKGGASCCTIM